MTVALNLVRSGLRRRRVERQARTRLGEGRGTTRPSTTEDRVDISRALSALPRRQREATVLRYYLDLRVAEIAAILRINQGTVKTTLFRARRALAKALGEPSEAREVNDSAGL